MSFNTRNGSRGARLPRGPLLRWANRLVARRVSRKGKVPGLHFDALVLTTVGAKTGAERKTPLGWFPGEDGSWLIVAAAAGAPKNPAWYYNLAANPDQVRIHLPGRTVAVTAEQLGGTAREEAWRQITTAAPQFRKYQEQTDRELPVIRLIPKLG